MSRPVVAIGDDGRYPSRPGRLALAGRLVHFQSMVITEQPVSLGEQHARNLRHWEAAQQDPQVRDFVGQVEITEHGRFLMAPPPDSWHGYRESRFTVMLDRLLGDYALGEMALSTARGVREIDAGWCSPGRYTALRHQRLWTQAPEICVEVLSPSNPREEMLKKARLYFEIGAAEVWLCHEDARMEFLVGGSPLEAIPWSRVCPDFPTQLES